MLKMPMNDPCFSNTPTTSNVFELILIRWPNAEPPPNRLDETCIPMMQTGRPPAASSAEKKCPSEMPMPEVIAYCSVVPRT